MRLTDRRIIVAAAALMCLGVASAASAASIPLNFNSSTGNQYFKANIAATGNITLGANASFRLSTGGVLGFTVSGGINIPNQALPLNLVPNPLPVNVVPTGSGLLTLGNQQFGGVDPGNDGTSGEGPGPFPGGLPSVLTDADITNMQLTLIQNLGIPIDNGPLVVNGNTSINTILGDINIDTTVRGTLNAALNNVGYTQDPGTDFLVGPGTRISPSGGTQTATYGLGAPGNIYAGLNASLAAEAELSILFGLVDIPISLGSFDLNQAISEHLALIGLGQLEDLNPGNWNGPPNFDDLRVTMNDGGFLSLLPLSFDLNTVATVPITLDTDFDALLVTFDIDVRGTATVAATIHFDVNGAGYQVQDTIEHVVIPEPSSVCLALLGVACVIPAIRRRLKKS